MEAKWENEGSIIRAGLTIIRRQGDQMRQGKSNSIELSIIPGFLCDF